MGDGTRDGPGSTLALANTPIGVDLQRLSDKSPKPPRSRLTLLYAHAKKFSRRFFEGMTWLFAPDE